jgi:hypothetical protein
MPVVVAGGGEAANTGDRPIDRQDRRIERNHSLTLWRSLSAGLALIVVIAAAGIAAWVGLFRDRGFTEPPAHRRYWPRNTPAALRLCRSRISKLR